MLSDLALFHACSVKSYRDLLSHSGTAFITNDTNGLWPCFATGTNPKFRIDSRLLLSFMDGRFVPFVLLFVLFVISALTANCIPSAIDGRWRLNRSPMGALLALQQLPYSLLQCLPVDTSQHKYPVFFYLKEDPVVANP